MIDIPANLATLNMVQFLAFKSATKQRIASMVTEWTDKRSPLTLVKDMLAKYKVLISNEDLMSLGIAYEIKQMDTMIGK